MKSNRWFSERPTLLFSVMPFAIALNLSMSYVVNLLKLPVFLDAVGTALIGCLFGPLPGALTGALSNIVGGLTINPVLPWFIGTQVLIGAWAGFVTSRGWMFTWWKSILAGLALGVLSAVISAPVITYVFGGVTASGAYSLIVAYARATGQTLLNSAFLAGLASDPVDKAITLFLCYLVLTSLPKRLRIRFPWLRKSLARQESS